MEMEMSSKFTPPAGSRTNPVFANEGQERCVVPLVGVRVSPGKAARLGIGKRRARLGPGLRLQQDAVLVAILPALHAIGVPRPFDAVQPVVNIGRFELMPDFVALLRVRIPQREGTVPSVVVQRHDRDARAARRPEDKRTGQPALGEGPRHPEDAIGHPQLVAAVGNSETALANDDVGLGKRLPHGERQRKK